MKKNLFFYLCWPFLWLALKALRSAADQPACMAWNLYGSLREAHAFLEEMNCLRRPLTLSERFDCWLADHSIRSYPDRIAHECRKHNRWLRRAKSVADLMGLPLPQQYLAYVPRNVSQVAQAPATVERNIEHRSHFPVTFCGLAYAA